MTPKLKFFKPTRGKFVSRSTYQKLAEENKKLLKDIKTLTKEGVPSIQKIQTIGKWRTHFKQKYDLNNLILRLLNIKRWKPVPDEVLDKQHKEELMKEMAELNEQNY